ncbi:ferrous iron transport protein B [Infirmifilum sp. SLHALR2]
MTERQRIRVALAGNPNVGKSVVFNNLTGSHQHVGNWPGKTVEKAEGFCYFDGTEIYIVDLPGTYSLTAYSIEERIARDYLIYEKPDVVVNIVDASNLERNLYLTLQLLELGANVVVALNKVDLLEASGARIDIRLLSERLGVPIVPTVAPKKKGMRELCEAVLAASKQPTRKIVEYSPSVEKYIGRVSELLRGSLPSELNLRWVAVKLLEGDEEVASRVKALVGDEAMRRIDAIRGDFARELGDPETVFAEERYKAIESILEGVVVRARAVTVSDILDQAFLDTAFGIPIFFAIMWIMFQFAFNVSAPFNSLLGDAFAWAAQMLSGATGVPWLDYLLFGDYGVLNGVGTVLSFVPLIMALFFALSMLEDFGYMARAAFLTDKILGKFGLPGRAIISMILGFGCNVPAVYSTRTIPDEKDRIAAIVINPLMLCGARLVFFAAIASALWGRAAGDVLLSLYALGILLSLLVAVVLRKTLLRGESTSFIIELPQYLMPVPRVALSKAWGRAKLFFTKAGKVIFPGILVLGLLAVFTPNLTFTENVEDSIVAYLGRGAQPIFAPLGWDWRFVVAAVFGFVAKEIVLGALALLYGAGEDEIATVIASTHDPLTVYAYMVFILIYVPCLATIAAIKQEAGTKWALFTVAYEILLAYGMAWLVLTVGRLLGV